MKRIIADTNIWYDISDEDLNLILKDYIVVVPIIVLSELYSSPKITFSQNNFNQLVKAVSIILKNQNNLEFIDYNPFEYLASVKSYGKSSILSSQFYLKEFMALTALTFNDVKNLPNLRPDMNALTYFINSTSQANGIEINKHEGTKRKFENIETLEKTKALILKFINENLETAGSYPVLVELKNNLLPLIFNYKLRTSSKVGNKFENNDWVDLFILSYVEAEDLYWTHEKSILNAFKKLSLEDSLFSYSFS